MAAQAEKFHWLQPILIALILVGLCLATLFLLRSATEIELGTLTSLPWLPLALLLQISASSLFIMAWQRWLRGIDRFSFGECTAHIGVTLLGKYIPGKIWGLLGRTVLLQRRGVSTQTAVDLLLADQFVTFYTGTALGVLALLAYFSMATSLAGALLIAVATLVLYRNYQGLLTWAWRKFGLLVRKFGSEFQPGNSVIGKNRLYEVSIIYLLHWLATATVVALLFTPVVENNLPGLYLLLIAAIPLAMLAGFLALWAPGGVGVREGIIIAILSLQLDVELAVAAAICYRLICILIDLVVGGLAFLYFASNKGLLQGRN